MPEKKDGVGLAARFSYITNSLRYCGPEEASKQFLDYLDDKGDTAAVSVKDSLNRFEGLQPYLRTISEKNGKGIKGMFDYDVVEAYWIGNRLLDVFGDDDVKLIITRLSERGLPASIAKDLIKNLPSGLVPHHNFNVMYVGVGRTAGTVPTTLQNMDNCRVSWGKVADIIDTHLIVQTQVLKQDDCGKFYLHEDETKTAVFMPQMLPQVKRGDVVALHWGFACHVLTQPQVENLIKYTQKILLILNSNM